jgi:hypothetical protein
VRSLSGYDRAAVPVDVFAVIPVRDYEGSRIWYERLFGSEPSFVAHETECVWSLGDHGHVAVNEDPPRAGHTAVTIFADDFERAVGEIASRGLEPVKRETYSNGVRKATYRDPDGNEVGYGGPAAE